MHSVCLKRRRLLNLALLTLSLPLADMSTALVRFLVPLRAAPAAVYCFRTKGYAVGGRLVETLTKAPPNSAAPALAAAFLAAAQDLLPTPLPAGGTSLEFDFRYDVTAAEGSAPVAIALREWTNETPVCSGGIAALKRHVENGFGQC